MGKSSREADQVARRIEFCAAHPEVSVEYRRETSRWEAAWPAGNGTETVSDHELWRVLDELERRLGQTRPRDGGAPPARRGSRHDGGAAGLAGMWRDLGRQLAALRQEAGLTQEGWVY